MENENYATREFPLKIETMCVRNPFDAHNPIYHPYHNTSNFVSVEEFYERYKKDNPSYELTKDYSSRKYAEYTDEMVFKSAIHIFNTSVKIYRTKKLNNGSRVTGSAI